jgi:hypothetical protein
VGDRGSWNDYITIECAQSGIVWHEKRGPTIETMVNSRWVCRKLRNFRAGIEAILRAGSCRCSLAVPLRGSEPGRVTRWMAQMALISFRVPENRQLGFIPAALVSGPFE